MRGRRLLQHRDCASPVGCGAGTRRPCHLWPAALAVAVAVVGCATGTGLGSHWSIPSRGPKTLQPDAPVSSVGTLSRVDFDSAIAARFEEIRSAHQDLTYPDLERKLGLVRAPESEPGFDPNRVAFFSTIRDQLDLTAWEQTIYRRTGLVVVDRTGRQTMAGAYLDIYRRDLPVLITTDSILHALHRSFDRILSDLETEKFLPAITDVLAKTHAALRAAAGTIGDPDLRRSAEDVDLYLTVARRLLATPAAAPEVSSQFGQDKAVDEILAAIASLGPEEGFVIYGGKRLIDWSQFKPRGHYSKNPLLEQYFQTVMWLGRADLGFSLAPPDPAFGARDARRELRDAALLARLISDAGQVAALDRVDRAIAFLVGLSDNLSVDQMVAAMQSAGLTRPSDLARVGALESMAQKLSAAHLGAQRIRSQVGLRMPGREAEKPLPEVFQLFGQRFGLDSFILSKVVFDSISFRGQRQERMMPTGLDVMAALGNDEAVALLQPELQKYNFAANLLAAREVVEARPPEAWDASAYDLWLSALSKLDDVPTGSAFPETMRSRAWQRKQLQTQLASWAELRHDTILYSKQSYTMGIVCEYPAGFVEPYPDFYARLALFAETMDRHLDQFGLARNRLSAFLTRVVAILHTLQRMADKELAAKPFDSDERAFVKNTIKVQESYVGCGPPSRIYTGWYPELIYGDAESWEPTVADVHTLPIGGSGVSVLEEAVGDVDLLVAAIDNAGDRAAYVGPVYSYYEFPSDVRLDDQQWREQLRAGRLPPRPEWTRAFRPGSGN